MLRKFESRICPECEKEITEYQVDEFDSRFERSDGSLIGTCKKEQASCPYCGQPLYVEELEKEYKHRRSECLSEWFGLMSLGEICALPRRYNISREHFETVLGITEFHKTTSGEIDKWCLWDGDTPNADEELALESVRDNPEYFIEMLEARRDLIPEDAYEKSLARAKMLADKK